MQGLIVLIRLRCQLVSSMQSLPDLTNHSMRTLNTFRSPLPFFEPVSSVFWLITSLRILGVCAKFLACLRHQLGPFFYPSTKYGLDRPRLKQQVLKLTLAVKAASRRRPNLSWHSDWGAHITLRHQPMLRSDAASSNSEHCMSLGYESIE